MSAGDVNFSTARVYPVINPVSIEEENIQTIIDTAGPSELSPPSVVLQQSASKVDWEKVQKILRRLVTVVSAIPFGVIVGMSISVSTAGLLMSPLGWGIMCAGLSLIAINIAISAYKDGASGARMEIRRAILGFCMGFGVGLFAGGVMSFASLSFEAQRKAILQLLGCVFGGMWVNMPTIGILIDHGFSDVKDSKPNAT